MSTPKVVQDFYERIWNVGDLTAIKDLLSEDFSFRGSLGSEHRGRQDFANYVRSVRSALANYRCEILECVTENDRAFAKMCFSGVHIGEFRGFPPTGSPVHWVGTALFSFGQRSITQLWVLGDLASLDNLLKTNQEKYRGPS